MQQIQWQMFWIGIGFFTFGLIAGLFLGYGWGKFKAQVAYWQRRDAEWDAEHLRKTTSHKAGRNE